MGLPDIPFTPQNASINRVRIVDLPGIRIDETVAGEQAYNLLSAPAIVRLTLQHAEDLHLPSLYTKGDVSRTELRRDLPLFLDACLSSSHQDVKDSAYKIANQLGRNLGFLLVTLHRGDNVNQAARSDWTSLEWEKWSSIRNIVVGGGIMSGRLGDQIIHDAQNLIDTTGYANAIQLRKAKKPRIMTIAGASRYLPSDVERVLCLDLGHTSLKAAFADFQNGVLVRLTLMPALDVQWSWRNDTSAQSEIDPTEVVDFITAHISQLWKNAIVYGPKLDKHIMICIAAYVRAGRLLGNGIYARMSLLADDVRSLLEDKLWERAGIHARIHLIHDGTAAAAVYAGEEQTAVLIFGTAIGVGFVPNSSEQLRAVSPDLLVTYLSENSVRGV